MSSAGDTLFGRGTLRMWDDEKGFGFIEPQEGGDDVFLHISGLADRTTRPAIGALITYRRVTDDQNRPRAIKARLEDVAPEPLPAFAPERRPVSLAARRSLANARPVGRSWAEPKMQAALGATIYLGVLAAAAALGPLPSWVPALYTLMSSVTFTTYYVDKTRAERQGRRIPENTLHLLEALGGWPGALVAQHWLSHKTGKVRYQVIFWLIVAAHFGLWVVVAMSR